MKLITEWYWLAILLNLRHAQGNWDVNVSLTQPPNLKLQRLKMKSLTTAEPTVSLSLKLCQVARVQPVNRDCWYGNRSPICIPARAMAATVKIFFRPANLAEWQAVSYKLQGKNTVLSGGEVERAPFCPHLRLQGTGVWSTWTQWSKWITKKLRQRLFNSTITLGS